MDLSYSKKVLQHFRNPKNMGEIKNPDGVATVGNPVCGDVMKIYLRIGDKQTGNKEEKIIKDSGLRGSHCHVKYYYPTSQREDFGPSGKDFQRGGY